MTTASGPTLAEITHRYEALYLLALDSEHVTGQFWYVKAGRELRASLTMDYDKRAELAVKCAILSPQLGWAKNIEAANASMRGYSRPPGVIYSFWDKAAAVQPVPDDTSDYSHYVSLYIDPLKAPKTWNFAMAIIDPEGPWPVIDRHMFDAAYMTKGAAADPWAKRRGSYALCARALHNLATQLDTPIPTLQATIWTTWKALVSRHATPGVNPLEHS